MEHTAATTLTLRTRHDERAHSDESRVNWVAHEWAHQWWGDYLTCKESAEIWLNESFATYFQSLCYYYLAPQYWHGQLRARLDQVISAPGGSVFCTDTTSVPRIFDGRLTYNKGAMVLHMLRRLVGDEMFFAGIRSFYQEWKFKKAGTDDFRKVMEKASSRDLQRFFDTWVYGFTVPHVKFTYHIVEDVATIRFEQHAEPVDVPITVTVSYASGATENVIVLLADKHTERAIPLKGPVRTITANADNAALVEIDR